MRKPPLPTISRRTLFAGAGAAGALAAVAVALKPSPVAVPVAVAPAAEPEASTDGRYQATAHVQRYYQTARI